MRSETKDQRERFVYGSQLTGVEATGGTPEALWIDHGGLLNEDASLDPVKLDGRTKRGWPNAGRGRRNKSGAHRHELIGLNDDGVASAFLLSSPGASRRRKPKDLAPNHLVERIRRELGHLLANDLHLGSICVVG